MVSPWMKASELGLLADIMVLLQKPVWRSQILMVRSLDELAMTKLFTQLASTEETLFV
jgi:hypothetical protein